MSNSTDYQYTAVTGESWLRAKRIVIENPLNGLSTAKFVEERVVNIAGGEQYFRDQGVLEATASEENLAEEIPILDPETGEETGEVVTYGEAYNLLKSAYIHFAYLRDNPPEPEPVEDPEVEDPTDDGEPESEEDPIVEDPEVEDPTADGEPTPGEDPTVEDPTADGETDPEEGTA